MENISNNLALPEACHTHLRFGSETVRTTIRNMFAYIYLHTFVSFSPAMVFSSINSLLGSFCLRFSKASLNFFILSLSLAFSVFLLYLLNLLLLLTLSFTLKSPATPCLLVSVSNLLATELCLRHLDLSGSVTLVLSDIVIFTVTSALVQHPRPTDPINIPHIPLQAEHHQSCGCGAVGTTVVLSRRLQTIFTTTCIDTFQSLYMGKEVV